MSIFSNFTVEKELELLQRLSDFAKDTFKDKVNLVEGTYKDENNQPWVLPVVRKAEKILANDSTLNKQYLATTGLEDFNIAATKFLLGADSKAIRENRALGIHTLSATGALRIGAELLVKHLKKTVFYHPSPTWGNHDAVFLHAGFKEWREYSYWSAAKNGLDFESMLEDLKTIEEHAVVILQACAHNPTGFDPTKGQWKQIAEVVKRRKLLPFFDCVYHGVATGDVDEDTWPVRYFVEQGIELLCAQSFSKNFGLYGERVGCLHFVVNDSKCLLAVKSKIPLIVRSMYICPPSHGARVVTYILNNPELHAELKQNIKTMHSRIVKSRRQLREALERLGTPGDWSFVTETVGMFLFVPFSDAQSTNLIEKHHVYILKSGRISVCSITDMNLEYVANSIHDSIINYK